MQEIILSALLGEWITRLSDEIDRLDATLPLDRKFKTEQRYIHKSSYAIELNVTPQRYPERYEEVQVPLPHTELDTLLAIVSDINEVRVELQRSLHPEEYRSE